MRPLWGLIVGSICLCIGGFNLVAILSMSGGSIFITLLLVIICALYIGGGWMLLSRDPARARAGLGLVAMCLVLTLIGSWVMKQRSQRIIAEGTATLNTGRKVMADYEQAQKEMVNHDWERFAPEFKAAGLTLVMNLYQSGQCQEGWNEFAQHRTQYERAAASGPYYEPQRLLQLADTGKSICETYQKNTSPNVPQ